MQDLFGNQPGYRTSPIPYGYGNRRECCPDCWKSRRTHCPNDNLVWGLQKTAGGKKL